MKAFCVAASALLASLTATAATFTADFNTGTVPSGSTLVGSATVQLTGGYTNSGGLRLTENVGGQVGGWLISDFSSGAAVNAFTATFKVELGPAISADGFSLNWGTNITGNAGEEGEGTGLTIEFDTFDNGGGEAPAIDIKWRGNEIAHSAVPFDFSAANAAYVAVQVTLTNGLVTVAWNGTNVHSNVGLVGFGSFSGAKFSFGGRTGGLAERHYIDDVSITTTPGSGSSTSFALRRTLLTDADTNGLTNPGDKLRYTISFTNTFGSNLLNTVITNPAAAMLNQTLVGGSITATPLGRSDAPVANSVPGNALHGAFNSTLNIPANAGLLTNDFLGIPAATITSFGGGFLGGAVTDHAAGTGATAAGIGTLTVNADGSLTFVPATGFTGLATFLYRLANAVGASDVQATIAIGVRPAANADSYNVTGNTMMDSTLIPQSLLANDTGDAIGFANLVTSPSHGTLSVAGANGHFSYTPAVGYTGPDSFSYTITNGFGGISATVNITVANRIWYIDNSVAANGDGRSTTPFKQTSDFSAVNDGAAGHPAANDSVFLRQGAGNYTGGANLLSGQRFIGDGVSGTFANFFGFSLAPGSAKAAGTAIPAFTGTRPFISLASGTGVSLNSGNLVVGMNVNSASGRAVSGGSVGMLILSNMTASATGDRALNIVSGSVIVRLDSASSTNSIDNGIVLSALGGSVTINGGFITGAAGTDFQVSGSAAAITYAGGINNTAGRSVDITNQVGGSVTLSGNITDTATGLIVQNCTSGTMTFSGASKVFNTGANTAVTLLNNSSAAINFTGGGLNLTTTTASGFSATGGGTVTVQGTGNAISSGTGTALNVAGTTIGASGLTFQSISANGGVNGIVLNNTGAGFLTVTGDGASDPANTTRGNTTAKLGGGTITAGSGGTIQNTTGSGVLLTSTGPITLTSMKILNAGGAAVNTGNNGITASAVNGLTLDNVLITGSTGNSGLRGNSTASAASITGLNMQHTDIDGNGTALNTEANNNWNVRLDDLAGTGTWQNSLFFNSRENIVGLTQGIALTTVNLTLTITNCEFRDTTTFASPANDAFSMSAFNSAVTTITASGSTFKNVEVGGFQFNCNDNASGTVNIRNNSFENTGSDILIAHNGGTPTVAKTLNFDISGNVERQLTGNPQSSVAINIFLAGNSLSGSKLVGTIKNNFIGTNSVAGSGSHIGDGIDVNATGAGTITTTVTNNTVHQIHQGDCFFAEANSGSARLNVFMHNNSFNTDTTTTALTGAHLVGGAMASDTATLYVDMGANTLHGDPTYTGIELDAFSTSSGAIQLVGLSTAFNDNATAIGNFAGSSAATTPPGVNTSVTPAPFAAAIGAGSHIIGVTNSVVFP